jgi:preprotein translocase subunit SecD
MSRRWYISILLLLFIYVGAFHEQVSAPNQEIVLEFSNESVDQNEVSNTIADLREKLQELGVSNIKIQITEQSTLKISYYSDLHIDRVKEVLLDESQFALNQTSNNKEDEKVPSFDYKIDVYELTDSSDISKRNNELILDLKYTTDRFTTPNHWVCVKSLRLEKANQLFRTALRTYKNNPFTKDHTSYQEPEVRAGPGVFFS